MKINWNFIPSKEKQDAYEDIIDKLNICTPEDFNLLSRDEQEKILDKMILEIRKINIFPIFYFNKEGVKKEIESVIKKEVCFTNDTLNIFYSQGLLLLDFLFPNLHAAIAGDRNSNMSIYDRFFDDNSLKECLRLAIKNRKIINMRTTFFTYARYLWRSAINYSPLRAKAIYEKFCPVGGTIYDYSCGFGGRMLGALSSKNNYTYIGTDPNTETFNNLLSLGKQIEEITKRKDSFEIYNKESENLILNDNSIDFAFSCPPFFSLEKYTDESTQSYNKYNKYEEWLEFYVRPTIKHCFNAIKENGLYGVDVMNFWLGGKKYFLVNDWIKIAEEEGFILKGIYEIKTKARKKNEEDQNNLYIFTKKENINLPDYTDIKTLERWKERLQQAERKKVNKKIIKYNIFGEYVEECLQINKEIEEAIKTKNVYNNFYYKEIKQTEEIPQFIKVKKPLCKTDNIIFYSCAELARYCNVSRQAATQSKDRKGKKINGHIIEWLI